MKFHVYYHMKLKEKGMEYTKRIDDQLINQFPCYYDNCAQVFVDYRGFKAHENKCHNEFIFKCRDPNCEYTGAKDNRVNHWRLQHTVDSYTCEECGKEYKWLDQFRLVFKLFPGVRSLIGSHARIRWSAFLSAPI